MNRVLTLGCFAAALVAAPVAAQAADAGRPSYRAPIPYFYNWSGFYAGAHIGGVDVDGLDSGFLGGGQIGYNYQVGQWVFGAEWDMSATSASKSVDVLFAHADVSLDWISTFAGRAGYAFDRWLVYGKLGAAWAHSSANVSVGIPGVGGFAASGSDTVSGWVFGVGTEYALQDNWSVKVEYNRLEFDPGTISVIKGGVNYRFGLDPRRY